MSPRKAQNVLWVLCGAGLIERQERDGTTNIYTLTPASQWKHPSELEKIRKTWKFTETEQAKDIAKNEIPNLTVSLPEELAS